MLSTIDLHGCSQSEAKVKLDHFLKGTSILVKEVTIVHGYSSSDNWKDAHAICRRRNKGIYKTAQQIFAV